MKPNSDTQGNFTWMLQSATREPAATERYSIVLYGILWYFVFLIGNVWSFFSHGLKNLKLQVTILTKKYNLVQKI